MIKTQDVAGVLIALKATGRVLVVAPAADEKLRLSARNLPTVDGSSPTRSLNVVDLVNADTVVIEQRRSRAWKRSTCERADRAGDRSPPGREREVDRPVDAWPVHLPGPPEGEQDQIKHAIEELYATDKVTVVLVNVLTTKAKKKSRGTRRGRIVGATSPWRKAVVTLAAGQKIQFFEGV